MQIDEIDFNEKTASGTTAVHNLLNRNLRTKSMITPCFFHYKCRPGCVMKDNGRNGTIRICRYLLKVETHEGVHLYRVSWQMLS